MIYYIENPLKIIIYLIINDDRIKNKYKTYSYLSTIFKLDRKTIKKYYEEAKFEEDLHDVDAKHTNLEKIEILHTQIMELLVSMFNFGEIDPNTLFSLQMDFIFFLDKIRKNQLKEKKDCIKY